jgi:hypothetical protein
MPRHSSSVPATSTHHPSSINTLRVSINLQPFLRQLDILQEIERHPHQMALDLVQLLPHNVNGLEQIVQMPRLSRPFSTKESVIVLEALDIIVRVRMEQVSEHFRIGGCARSPHVPEVFVERVADHGVVLVAGFPDVVAVAWRLGVGVLGGVEGLGVQEAEVLAPQHAAEGRGVLAGGVGLAVHHGGEGRGVFHDDSELAVVEAELGAVVDVAAAADCDAVVDDEELQGEVSLNPLKGRL